MGAGRNGQTITWQARGSFYSDRPSAADLAIYGVFSAGFEEDVTPEFAELASQRPALADWFKRVEDTRRLDGES